LAGQDTSLLVAVSHPEFSQNGLRNRDLRPFLYPQSPHNQREQKRQSGAVSRKLAMLRAHGLIRKVPYTHRYLLTEFGREVITAVLAAQNANTLELAKLAA
jgi:hypothetical protein